MKDILRKTLLIGVGLVSVTREKIEEITDDLIKKGELSEKEGRDLLNEMLEKSREARKDLEARMEQIVADALNRFNIPTRKEIQELKQRIAVLEKENVERLERERDILDKQV